MSKHVTQSSERAPLKLFWWKNVPNFGDVLSRDVVAHVSGRPVDWAPMDECDIVAIGSILHFARNAHINPRADGSKPWIWGSGSVGPHPRDFMDNVEIALLRGPVTASIMMHRMKRFGDPGLLAPDVYGLQAAPQDRIGFLPHISQLDDPRVLALRESESALHFIDVRQGPDVVVREIATCRHVVASSLHALIIADAMGIPNTWLDLENQGLFKFYDYGAAIGRWMRMPHTLDDVPEILRGLKDNDRIDYSDGIARARADILESFPDELRLVSAEPVVAS